MDTRESKTPEEEREHLKAVRQPEDFDHPEPDEGQPEARRPSQGLHRVLPVVIAVLGLLAVAMLMLSGGD